MGKGAMTGEHQRSGGRMKISFLRKKPPRATAKGKEEEGH